MKPMNLYTKFGGNPSTGGDVAVLNAHRIAKCKIEILMDPTNIHTKSSEGPSTEYEVVVKMPIKSTIRKTENFTHPYMNSMNLLVKIHILRPPASITYLLPKKRQQVDGPTNTCGANEEDSGDRDGENADMTSVGPQPQEGTTHTYGEKLPPGPKDLSQLPGLKIYLAIEYSGQSRSFNKNWHDQHSWLEYSVTQDAVFCFACRLFSHTHFSKTEKPFTHESFWNWKKVTTSLKSHDNSAGHTFAMQAWAEFKLQKTKGARIQHALDASHAETVEENRHYIRAVIDALLYTACQNEAQRGHREGSQSDNRGNFLELLDMISRYDEIVKNKPSGPGNAKYTHHDIQNELLDIIAGMIRKDINKEVMEAGHFALMVDETKDCYAGAVVMSGHNSGVQERFRREVSQAVYVHCYAHRLNFVLVDCVHNIQAAAEFFVTIQKLYKFFSTSVVYEEFLKVQKELEPVNQHIELKRLSDTRWACQHAACLAVKRTLPAIVTTLKRFVEGDNVHRATESKGLCILLDQQFVTSLVAIEKLLLMIKQLSDHLQSPDLQLDPAEDLKFKGYENYFTNVFLILVHLIACQSVQ
ncbi:zinc finger MYM-type protein 1-like [Tachypleus tridentatus]|uniref:zinc finger MYM-type protein 1-like n=1 Tax=Tachypleus tridentatus TaxID=6853 RepID=UPI003FCF9A25